MPGFGEVLGKTGEAAWQLFVWQIMGQVVGSLLTPYLTELTYLVNETHPDIVLPVNDLVSGVLRGQITREAAQADAAKLGIDGARFTQLLEIAHPRLAPADLAQLVVRNFMPRDEAHTEAELSGVDPHRLDLLTLLAGDAPAPGDLAVGLRRGIIAEDGTADGPISFAQGIREGRTADKYIPLFKDLAIQWPSPTEALHAELNGQLTHAEALKEYERLGGDPQFYTWLFDTLGTAPSPVELGVLLNRGIIQQSGTGPDSTSFEQGILEGPSRNKWIPAWLALREYITPPRSVVAMVHQGVVTDPKAAQMLAKAGMPPDEIAAYIAEGHARASQNDRALTQATVIALYEGRVISATDAHNLLTALRYSDQNATYLVELASLRRVAAAVTAAVSRIRNLYVAHKITRDAAVTSLDKLKVPGDQVSELVTIWDLEASVTVRQLTPAQIVAAAKKNIIPVGEALDELVSIGYTRRDGWILLAEAIGKDAGTEPGAGPNPVGVIP